MDAIEMMTNYLIPIGLVFFFSVASAIFYNRESGFNNTVLMVSLSIGIAVLVWIPCVPSYFISISALLLLGVIFTNSNRGGVA
jgi:hypothetical protein